MNATLSCPELFVHRPCSPLAFDALLQASRRLDWRFLLPDPNLDVVLYIGPADDALAESLRLFSASLTVAGSLPLNRPKDNFQTSEVSKTSEVFPESLPMSGRHLTRYGVVVAREPSYDTIRRGAELVRPDGWLYLEARRRWPLRLGRGAGGPARDRNGRRLRSAEDYLRAVAEAGCDEAAAYWHWPDFESCAEIVPLSDSAAVLHALGRRRHDARARIKATFGRVLVRLGLFARCVPCFSILAHRRKNS